MRKGARKAKYEQYDNVVEFDAYRKKRQVTILPRNRNQETYLLKLLDESFICLNPQDNTAKNCDNMFDPNSKTGQPPRGAVCDLFFLNKKLLK